MVALEICALVSAVVLNATPFVDVRTMIRSGETKDLAPLPWAALMVNASLWLIYGVMIRQLVPMAACNAVGVIASTCALVTYRRLERDKYKSRRASRLFVCGGVVVLGLLYICSDALLTSLTYADDVSPSLIRNLGMLGVVVNFMMFATPLAELSKVLRTRSTKTLSLPWAVATFVCGLAWTLMGLKMDDIFVFAPNCFGLLLAFVQFYLFARFGVVGSSRYYSLPLAASSVDAKRAFGL